MAGRRPKPNGVKEVVGTIRPDRIREDGKTPPEGEAVMPRSLKRKAEIALWIEFAPICKHLGTLTVADTRTLANWCVLQAKFDRLRGEMKDSGTSQLRQLAASLGLDATSKVRIGSVGKKKKDETDEFFEKSG